jgi:hypothetical protein
MGFRNWFSEANIAMFDHPSADEIHCGARHGMRIKRDAQ